MEKRKPKEFNLIYEGYDSEPEFNLFNEAFYISDSEWTQWKCYNKGVLVKGDNRSPWTYKWQSQSYLFSYTPWYIFLKTIIMNNNVSLDLIINFLK